MSLTIVSVLVVYLLILLAIGFWGARSSRTIDGYYLAGKRLPSWVIAFSSNTTGESAWLLLGLTGMGYAVGAHALWVIVGEVLGVALGWSITALPFKRMADRYGSITVPDFLESRFHDSRHVLRILSIIIIFSMVMAYTSAQLKAAGKAFGSFLGMDYTTGVLVGAAVILFYTSVGGLKAVAYSDVLQGVLMFLGLIALPVMALWAAGGWSPMIDGLSRIDDSLLDPMGGMGLSPAGLFSAASFFGIGLAFLGAPQLLIRFMSAKSEREIVKARPIAILCMIVFDVGAVLAGMAGRVLYPSLSDQEAIMPTLSAELFPAVFTGIFLVIVLAAMMSTVDSLVIMLSSAIVRDGLQKTLGSKKPEQSLSLYGKLATIVVGGGAIWFALSEGFENLLFWFILFAWSGLACAFAPVVLCALFWKGTSREGAIAGMAGGFLTSVIWIRYIKADFYNLYEMWPGYFVAFFLIVVVSMIKRPTAEVRAELDH